MLKLLTCFLVVLAANGWVSPWFVGRGEYGSVIPYSKRKIPLADGEILLNVLLQEYYTFYGPNTSSISISRGSIFDFYSYFAFLEDKFYKLDVSVGSKLFECDIVRVNSEYIVTKYISNIAPSPQLPISLQIKIMSWNIFNYNDFWNRRVNLISSQIQLLDPDVIGFQEVKLDTTEIEMENSQHQMSHLKNRLIPLGYKYYVHQSAMFYGLPRSEEGLAIFSKHPILETEYILLSRDQEDSGSHQRICLWALIQTPIGPIQFFVTHLELVLAMSASNAQDIVSYADQKLKELNTPQILVGDMNAESDSETIQILSKSFHDAFISAGSPKEHELTFQTQGNYQKRIDFCFHRKWKLNVTDFKVIDQVMNGTHASDHYGVQVTFEK